MQEPLTRDWGDSVVEKRIYAVSLQLSFGFHLPRQVDGSGGRPVGRSVGPSASRLVGRAVCRSIGRSAVGRSVGRSVGWSGRRSVWRYRKITMFCSTFSNNCSLLFSTPEATRRSPENTGGRNATETTATAAGSAETTAAGAEAADGEAAATGEAPPAAAAGAAAATAAKTRNEAAPGAGAPAQAPAEAPAQPGAHFSQALMGKCGGNVGRIPPLVNRARLEFLRRTCRFSEALTRKWVESVGRIDSLVDRQDWDVSEKRVDSPKLSRGSGWRVLGESILWSIGKTGMSQKNVLILLSSHVTSSHGACWENWFSYQ